MRRDTTCEWSENENGAWDTGCGNCFELTDGTPHYNDMHFCPYCGENIVEKRHPCHKENEVSNLKVRGCGDETDK